MQGMRKYAWKKIVNAGFGKFVFISKDGCAYGLHRQDGKFLIPNGDTFMTAEAAAAVLDMGKLERAWGVRRGV